MRRIELPPKDWKSLILTIILHMHIMGEVGLEPTMHKATDLQSAAIPFPLTLPNQLREQDLNLQLPTCKDGTLTSCVIPQ